MILILTSARSYKLAASSKRPFDSASLATCEIIFDVTSLNFSTHPGYNKQQAFQTNK